MDKKSDLKSPDLVNENFEKLAALFPNCVTEGAEGKAIDFDLLRQELSHAVVEGNKERYRLEWPGEAIVTANLPTTQTLRPVREDSVNYNRIWFGKSGNNTPRVKKFISEVKDGITPMTVWSYKDVGHSQEAAQKLKILFDGKNFFDYPKSAPLLERVFQLYSTFSQVLRPLPTRLCN